MSSRLYRIVSLLFLFLPALAAAQASPAGRWLTLHSEHFRVHYRPGGDTVASHAAREGERAYQLLARELMEPTQTIDLVLRDDADFSNGAATVFPSNRIVLLLTPPLSEPELQNYDDWIRVLLIHELTHIFHLERVKGPWRLIQSVLGRAPGTFPNAYQPSWVAEGLATYYESRLSQGGRIRGSFHTQILLAAARDDRWLRPNEATYLSDKWPDGIAPYAFGSRFFHHFAQTAGDSSIPRFVEATSGQWIPFRTGRPLWRAARVRRDSAWTGLAGRYDSMAVARGRSAAETVDSRLRSQPSLAIASDGSLAWFTSRADETAAIVVRRADGSERHYLSTSGVDLAWQGDTLYATRLEIVDALTLRSDLHRLTGDGWRQVTYGERLTDIAVSSIGVVAVQVGGDGNRLVIVSGDSTIPLTVDPPRTTWAAPAIHPSEQILAVQHDRMGYHLSMIVPGTAREGSVVTSNSGAILADPSWNEDGTSLLYVSDVTGLPQVYAFDWTWGSRQVTDEPTGATQPVLSPDGWLYFAALESDGYALKRVRWVQPGDEAAEVSRPVEREVESSLPSQERENEEPVSFRRTGYSFAAALRPHYLIPFLLDRGSAGKFLGAFTSGSDPIGRVAYTARLAGGFEGGRIDGSLSLIYRRWNHHALDWYVSQDHGDAGQITAPVAAVVRRRERDAVLGLTTTWRRWYRSLSVRLAADYEEDRFFSTPALRFINPEFAGASLGMSLSRLRRPPLAISNEDGASLSLRYRRRWRLDRDGWSDEWRGRFAAYWAIKGFGGFAHPVIAGRIVAATSSGPDRETFGIGGASGVTYQPLPGIVAGSSRQFPVRGYQPGEIRGETAAVATVELRVPVALVAEPFWSLPYGLDRVGLRVFYDYGRLWNTPVGGHLDHLGSVGVEVTWDLVVLYDVPLRLRTGLAVALSQGTATRRGDVQFGVGFGSEF